MGRREASTEGSEADLALIGARGFNLTMAPFHTITCSTPNVLLQTWRLLVYRLQPSTMTTL